MRWLPWGVLGALSFMLFGYFWEGGLNLEDWIMDTPGMSALYWSGIGFVFGAVASSLAPKWARK